MSQLLQSALKLHKYMVLNHWNGRALLGPDPGVRFNYRVGRFIKSYLSQLSWNDDLYYLQGQGYWVLSNWSLFMQSDNPMCQEIAVRCSKYMLTQQRDDGAWEYPNLEWKGRVATTEGCWGSIGLLESYRRTKNQAFLDAVLRWHKFLIEKIGFQQSGDELAINYFANDNGSVRVPNNSITVLRFLAELAEATSNPDYLKPAMGLLNFIRRAQMPTGEFPYSIGEHPQQHFQCYQYNAFESLNLMRYYQLTQDNTVLSLITGQLNFLSHGLAPTGYAYYDCTKPARQITYHTAALAAAFATASRLGIIDVTDLANQAYAYVLARQTSAGGFFHSRRDYGWLADRRSYPRYLAMILYHLLHFVSQSSNKTYSQQIIAPACSN